VKRYFVIGFMLPYVLGAVTFVSNPPAKGIAAWTYNGLQQRYVNELSAYDTAVQGAVDGANRRVRYLFPWAADVSDANPNFDTRYVTAWWASKMPGVAILPNVDGDGAVLDGMTTAQMQTLADLIASKINADPNAAGVHIDIEPFRNAHIPFYARLRADLNANVPRKVQTMFTGATFGSIYSNSDIVVFSGYDLGINPLTPLNYENVLYSRVGTALASARAGGSYLLVGVPASASYEEYYYSTGSCPNNTGYTQEQWFKGALNALCGHYFEGHYLGPSLWSFFTVPLSIPTGSNCLRYPAFISPANYEALTDMNPPACDFIPVTPSATPTRSPTPSTTISPTPTPTRSPTPDPHQSPQPTPTRAPSPPGGEGFVLRAKPVPNPLAQDRGSIHVETEGACGDLKLRLFGKSMQPIEELIFPGPFNPGWHALGFDAANLPSGTYFYSVALAARPSSRAMGTLVILH
jgi:hypothetical protein